MGSLTVFQYHILNKVNTGHILHFVCVYWKLGGCNLIRLGLVCWRTWIRFFSGFGPGTLVNLRIPISAWNYEISTRLLLPVSVAPVLYFVMCIPTWNSGLQFFLWPPPHCRQPTGRPGATQQLPQPHLPQFLYIKIMFGRFSISILQILMSIFFLIFFFFNNYMILRFSKKIKVCGFLCLIFDFFSHFN